MISARSPESAEAVTCSACGGEKQAPIAVVVVLGPRAELHPTLRVAHDARALERVEEANQLTRQFDESGEDVFVDRSIQIVLCEECGRDAANAIGFMCIKDGGWSKLEPRRSALKSTGQKTLKKLQRSAR